VRGKSRNPNNRFPLVRVVATCLGLAAVGAAVAFSAGPGADSPLGIAGAILMLVAVLTGLAAVLTTFILDFPAILRALDRQVSGGARRNEPTREGANRLQSRDQTPDTVTPFSIFVVAVILLFNVAIIAFLFSPLSKTPIALLFVALAGFAVAASFLFSARVRAWLRQFLRTARG
jgi:hypothetical protein